MNAGLASAIEQATGTQVAGTSPMGGGSTSTGLAVTLAPGERLFAKHTPGAPAGMFRGEAEGLAWLAEPGCVRVPAVVTVDDDWLVLEWIDEGARSAASDEALGRGIARMHRAGAAAFGAPWPGFAGSVPVPNDPRDDWPTFLAERRLLPIADAARLPTDMRRRLDAVLPRLPDLLGPAEPPSRLHGDLWAGNHMTDARGRPVLIDCDAYGGHREIDIGMMLLFGGFGDRVIAAYDEEYPLAPGWQDRVELNQLLPLLVHCAMLGSGWFARANAVLQSVS
ncbi:MAG: fructosamine kinase family protein [Actinobacteria bacterium]|nr:fructosamine kinase family protein [Actinomycetota bacterium]